MNRKVLEMNIEKGMPTAEKAVQNMKNLLLTYKRQDVKAVIIIHGYGSTGNGGIIKIAVRKALNESSLRGLVRAFVGGEEWLGKKKEFLSMCKYLEAHERHISGNQGITVVLLK